MKRKALLRVLLLIIAIVFVAGSVASCSRCAKMAGTPEEFSANVMSTTPMGTFSGKVFVTKDRTRMELAESTIITRLDKKAVYILLPTKMYMEQPLGPEYAASVGEKLPGEISRELVGREEVGGRSAQKFKVTYMLDGKEDTVFQWIDDKLGLPLKVAAPDGTWSLIYTDIKAGSQPDKLFEVPDDYSKFSMPQNR